MFFDFDIFNETNIFINNPKTTKVILGKGIITQISILFPAGCAGLVGIMILRGSLQFIPLQHNKYISSDNETIVIDTDFDLTVNPYNLNVITYNHDIKFTHTLRLRFKIEPVEIIPKHQTLRGEELNVLNILK